MKIVDHVKLIAYFYRFDSMKNKKEYMTLNNLKKMFLKKIAKSAYNTAKTEADSACFCFCYQPVMPKKVKDLRKRKH